MTSLVFHLFSFPISLPPPSLSLSLPLPPLPPPSLSPLLLSLSLPPLPLPSLPSCSFTPPSLPLQRLVFLLWQASPAPHPEHSLHQSTVAGGQKVTHQENQNRLSMGSKGTKDTAKLVRSVREESPSTRLLGMI